MTYLLSVPQNKRHKRHIRHGAMTHPSQASQSVIENPMKSMGMTLMTLMTDKSGPSEKGMTSVIGSVIQSVMQEMQICMSNLVPIVGLSIGGDTGRSTVPFSFPKKSGEVF